MVVRSSAVLVRDFVLRSWRLPNPRQRNEAMREHRSVGVAVLKRIDHISALVLLWG